MIALIEHTEFLGRKTNLLNDQRNGTFLNICPSNGQRHTLAFLVYTYDDEVASLTTLCN